MTVPDYKWQPTAKADFVWRTLSGQAFRLEGKRNVSKTIDKPQKHRGNTPCAKPEKTPPIQQHPNTHVPCVGSDWPH